MSLVLELDEKILEDISFIAGHFGFKPDVLCCLWLSSMSADVRHAIEIELSK